ncbi:MAG: hypothetical protein ACE5JS_07865 [Nitrospinota bacterium]
MAADCRRAVNCGLNQSPSGPAEVTKERILSKIRAIAVVVTITAISLSLSAQAAEKKQVSGSGKSLFSISRTVMYPRDLPRHQMLQQINQDFITSSDPDFNRVQVLVYSHSDTIAGNGTDVAYRVHFHKNGEKTYIRSQGTHEFIVKEGGAWEVLNEGKWQFTGGTGKFKNVKGTGTYKGKVTPMGSNYEWKGEVTY